MDMQDHAQNIKVKLVEMEQNHMAADVNTFSSKDKGQVPKLTLPWTSKMAVI